MLIQLFLSFVVAGFVFMLMMRYRWLPESMLRFWFALNTFIALTLSWLSAHILRALSSHNSRIISPNKCEILVRQVCALFLGRFHRACNQHIHLHTMPNSLPWNEIKGQYVICMNHTSFFDTLLFLWKAPFSVMKQIRAFAKASLLNLPLFGYILESCKHFIVYFKDDNSTSFSVDKERQTLVSEEVEKFLCNGGCLSFFPEGAMNKNPFLLQDFRLGSMTTILKYKLDIYYCVAYGGHIIWPLKLIGRPGHSADIYLYLGKFEYDPNSTDANTLAINLRKEMQSKLDEMLATKTIIH